MVLCVPQYCNLSLLAMCGHFMPLQAAALVFQLLHTVPLPRDTCVTECHGVAKVVLSGKAMETGTNPPPVVASSQGCLKIQALENAPRGSYVSEGF